MGRTGAEAVVSGQDHAVDEIVHTGSPKAPGSPDEFRGDVTFRVSHGLSTGVAGFRPVDGRCSGR